jgi:hypothetical protein
MGEGPADIAEYLREYQAEGYPVDQVVDSHCTSCRGSSFRLTINALSNDGAQPTCITCGSSAFIADSEDYWDDAEVARVACPCGGDIFEIAVGFALREAKDDVKWIGIGIRCVTDGVLGAPVDWKISYGSSLRLLQRHNRSAIRGERIRPSACGGARPAAEENIGLVNGKASRHRISVRIFRLCAWTPIGRVGAARLCRNRSMPWRP